jgi:hypothetical protein
VFVPVFLIARGRVLQLPVLDAEGKGFEIHRLEGNGAAVRVYGEIVKPVIVSKI